MEKKSVAALIVTGAMVLGLSACGTNGAAYAGPKLHHDRW